ncbi:DUF3592 domain-containing protein [Chitinophaga sp. NPDC101104]|uniref:DUF3592 domain-containing protein n=1 Tax=Chitinophaga sp. NPDC101104 TaxID=3390561 RepID=UPI003D00ACF7
MLYKIYLLTGIILLLVSFYQLKRSLDFIGRGQRTTGTVTSLEEIDGAFSPVFTLKTGGDAPVRYHHAAASNPSAWAIGEEAIFLYDPADPQSAKMLQYFWLFNWALLYLVIALPLLIFGIGYFWLRPLFRARRSDNFQMQSNRER